MNSALYISLIIFFVNACFSPGSIFGFVGEYIESPDCSKLIRTISKPLFACVVCMAPWYTFTICYFLFNWPIAHCLLMIGIVGGLNVIIASIIDFLNQYNGLDGRA